MKEKRVKTPKHDKFQKNAGTFCVGTFHNSKEMVDAAATGGLGLWLAATPRAGRVKPREKDVSCFRRRHATKVTNGNWLCVDSWGRVMRLGNPSACWVI